MSEYIVEFQNNRIIDLVMHERIVRCRDCVYYKQDPEPTDPDWPMVGGCVVVGVAESNGYCAWGERRGI